MKKFSKKEILINVELIIEKDFGDEPTGHDFYHAKRVVEMAKIIAKMEKKPVNMFILELGAWLHDISDWKLNKDEKTASKKLKEILTKLELPEKVAKDVEHIVDNVSFRGAKVKNEMKGLEGKIIQDADRLDALGAIGIGRAFATGAFRGRQMYNPKISPTLHSSFSQYKKDSTTINHFYEKLLLLKDRMNTKSGMKIAKERQEYMESFLKKFLEEWNGKY